jgi:hypothetical protein
MKALLAFAILLALPGAAAADWQPAEIYVIAMFAEMDSVVAAEFAIANLPDEAMCQITAYWNTPIFIGDLETGIAMIFQPPLAGWLAVLGRLEFIAWEPFPDDYIIQVVETATGNLILVDPETWTEFEADGGIHTFNCSGTCDCGWGDSPVIGLFAEETALTCYQDIEVFTTPVDESSWSAVKSLY